MHVDGGIGGAWDGGGSVRAAGDENGKRKASVGGMLCNSEPLVVVEPGVKNVSVAFPEIAHGRMDKVRVLGKGQDTTLVNAGEEPSTGERYKACPDHVWEERLAF